MNHVQCRGLELGAESRWGAFDQFILAEHMPHCYFAIVIIPLSLFRYLSPFNWPPQDINKGRLSILRPTSCTFCSLMCSGIHLDRRGNTRKGLITCQGCYNLTSFVSGHGIQHLVKIKHCNLHSVQPTKQIFK